MFYQLKKQIIRQYIYFFILLIFLFKLKYCMKFYDNNEICLVIFSRKRRTFSYVIFHYFCRNKQHNQL